MIRLGRIYQERRHADQAVDIYRIVMRTFPQRDVASQAKESLRGGRAVSLPRALTLLALCFLDLHVRAAGQTFDADHKRTEFTHAGARFVLAKGGTGHRPRAQAFVWSRAAPWC